MCNMDGTFSPQKPGLHVHLNDSKHKETQNHPVSYLTSKVCGIFHNFVRQPRSLTRACVVWEPLEAS